MSFKVKILGKTFFEIESDKVANLKKKAVAEKKNEEFGQVDIGTVKSFIREMIKSYDHFKEKREELVKK